MSGKAKKRPDAAETWAVIYAVAAHSPYVKGMLDELDTLTVHHRHMAAREILRDVLSGESEPLPKAVELQARGYLAKWRQTARHGNGEGAKYTQPITTWVTVAEFEEIEAASTAVGMKRSEYLRRLVQADLGRRKVLN